MPRWKAICNYWTKDANGSSANTYLAYHSSWLHSSGCGISFSLFTIQFGKGYGLATVAVTKFSFLSEVRKLDKPSTQLNVPQSTTLLWKETSLMGINADTYFFIYFMNHCDTPLFSYSLQSRVSHCTLWQSNPLKARESFSIYRSENHSAHVSFWLMVYLKW